LTLTAPFSSVTFLAGDTVILSCIPSKMEFVVMWIYDQTNVSQRENITFSPPGLNHTLHITNTSTSDSGIYICRTAVCGKFIEQNINVSIIEGICICIIVSTFVCVICNFNNAYMHNTITMLSNTELTYCTVTISHFNTFWGNKFSSNTQVTQLFHTWCMCLLCACVNSL